MATLRNKVWKQIGEQAYYVPLLRGEQSINIVSGADDGQLLSAIPYGSSITTQGLLNILIDLMENDRAINTETNGINRVISEGVIALKSFQFDLTHSASPNKITIGGGAAKLHESESVYSVYQISSSTIFTISSIHTTGWYRRDLVQIVFKDTSNPNSVPYLEYVYGQEGDFIPPRHTLASKSVSSTKNSYPLWSVLYRNIGGTTTYVESDQVFEFGGYKETVKLIHTLVFKKDINKGYYASLHERIQFTNAEGTPIPLSAGESATSYEVDEAVYNLETICSNDPTGKLSLQEPDIQFRNDLSNGDLLTFPFRMDEINDDYLASQDVELNEITIAIDKDTKADEGIELHLYTAKYFVNDYNNGIVPVLSASVGTTETTLTLDLDITTFTKITGNNKDFLTPVPWEPVEVGDFIFVHYGKGLYQTSPITSITDGTHIKVRNMPITLDATSKILIYKNSTVELSGEEITQAFLDAQTYDNQIKYGEKYPHSSHTGISILPWDDATYGYQELGLTGVASGVNTGLSVQSYKVKVAIDGGVATEYTITVSTTPYTFGSLISDLNTAISGAEFAIIGGDVRCTSDSVGPTSTIAITAGTSNDLLTALSASVETAIPGENVSSDYARAKGTVALASGHDWASVNQSFDITMIIDGVAGTLHTITLDSNCTTVDLIVTHINNKFTSAGINSDVVAYKYIGNTVAFRTTRIGANQGFILAAGTPNALATLGITDATYKGTKLDIDYYCKLTASATTRLFYHMPTPPGTNTGHIKVVFPFKVRVNYNQWYFLRSSVRDRNIPYAEYGVRPKVVVLDSTWAASNSSSICGYYNIQVNTNTGSYPYYVDGDLTFKIEDDYGDICTPSVARAYRGYPSSYIIHSRNLLGSAFAHPTDAGHAYVDVMNGIVSFVDDVAEEPKKLYLTYYYNSIITGSLWTDNIQHEKLDGTIWNLQMLIENLVNGTEQIKTGSTTALIDITPNALDPSGSGSDYDFQPGDIIRYDININPTFGWCKAIATNFHYTGDAMVVERIDNYKFKIIQIGYIDNVGILSDIYTATIVDDQNDPLKENTIYYLSPLIKGRLTAIKPVIAQPVLFTFDDNGGLGVTQGLVTLTSKSSFLELYNVNEKLTQKCEDLSNQVDLLTKQTLELMSTVAFLGGRVNQDSDYLVENFVDKSNTSKNTIIGISNPCVIMDDNDWDFNWKKLLSTALSDYKQGFLAPMRTSYYSEPIGEYDLTGLGQTYKGSIDYDATNQCYWLITNAGANAVGEILKLTLDGKINISARWLLPAGGASTYWTGIASDGTYLYILLRGATSSYYKVVINSDGTLGKAGYIKYTNQILAATIGDMTTMANAASSVARNYNDVKVWSSTQIAFLHVAASTLTLYVHNKSDLLDATLSYNLNELTGNGTTDGRSFYRTGNYLWIRQDDTTLDLRKIYKVDLTKDITGTSSPYTCIGHSGAFYNGRDVDGNSSSGGNGGICFDQRGDLLECISTASNGNVIIQHAIANAFWGENQTVKYKKLTDAGTDDNRAICFKDTGYVWYSANNTNNNAVRLVRRNLTDNSEIYCTVNGGNWTIINGLEIEYVSGTLYCFFLGYTGSAYISRAIPYATVVAAMTSGGGSLDMSVAGVAFTGFETAKMQTDICSDGSYLYIISDADDTIDKWELLATPTKVEVHIYLSAATTNWYGITYSNGNFIIFDYNSAAAGIIYSVSATVKRPASPNWFQTHRYQYIHSSGALSNGGYQLSMYNGDLYQIKGLIYIGHKTLEDPYAIQYNHFLTTFNVLLSLNVLDVAFGQRYFSPTVFKDSRNVPDKNYMGVAYGDEGFSILHCDAYFSGKSSAGMDRFNPVNIVVHHAKRAANNFVDGASVTTKKIAIEADMIIVGTSVDAAASIPRVQIMDLVSGRSWRIGYSADTTAGYYYNGSWSERNDACGWTGTQNTALTLTSATGNTSHVIDLHAVTFDKNDASSYSFTNKKTFIGCPNGGTGGHDLIVVDWGDNYERTPYVVLNNLFGGGSYIATTFIAPSGRLFGGTQSGGGSLYYLKKYVWELQISTDEAVTTNNAQVGTLTFTGIIKSISKISPCWKTPPNTWKHKLIVSTYGTAHVCGVYLVDVENGTKEAVFETASGAYSIMADMFENKIYSANKIASTSEVVYISKKLRFDDNKFGTFTNFWTSFNTFTNLRDPIFTAKDSTYVVGGRFFHKISMFAEWFSNNGVQLMSFPHNNLCEHESVDFTCENPKYYFYKAGVIDDGGTESN